MSALKIFISIGWVVFWIYWLLSAAGAKHGSRNRQIVFPRLLIIVLVLIMVSIFKGENLAVDDPALHAVGAALFVSGLSLAVWARIYLGHNWGMPMTQKDEPELVTSGPYRYVRHPIYSGILLGVLGTALVIAFYWLVVFGVMGAYFVYSARVEEGLMTSSFPTSYPSYRSKTKMLIPFVF